MRLTILRNMGETSDFSEVKISNGNSSISKVGVTVQRGVGVRLDVRMQVRAITENDFKTWLDSTHKYFSEDQVRTLKEGHSAGGFLGGLLCGAFGLLFGAGNYNHFKDQKDTVIRVEDTVNQGFLKSLRNVAMSDVEVTGGLWAFGETFQPVTGYLFVETTSVEFKDGTVLRAINSSSPVLADLDGNVVGRVPDKLPDETPQGKISIIPVGGPRIALNGGGDVRPITLSRGESVLLRVE
ncbi:hypothetical protein JKA73_10875 [Myxococcus xanthus]|uniref:hypothetical protein n=1 Tax=Myxococcus xanthus TaxID=34 RepID=UPI0019171804|nr:hypothetical protein [Myxococcus xanthus]QQR46531.1 hypothetical protein JKA73_10875 [Myxococcus xanthus]